MTSASRSFSLGQLMLAFVLIGLLISYYQSRKLDAENDFIVEAFVSRDGKYLVVESSRRLLVFFDLETKRLHKNFRLAQKFIALRDDLRHFVGLDLNTDTLCIADLHTGKIVHSTKQKFRDREYNLHYRWCDYSSENNWAIFWAADGLQIFSLTEDRTLQKFEGVRQPFGQVQYEIAFPAAFSPDGNLAAVAGDELTVWDSRKGGEIQELRLPDHIYNRDSLRGLVFSPNNKSLVCNYFSELYLWELHEQGVKYWKPPLKKLFSLPSYSPDSSRLVFVEQETYDWIILNVADNLIEQRIKNPLLRVENREQLPQIEVQFVDSNTLVARSSDSFFAIDREKDKILWRNDTEHFYDRGWTWSRDRRKVAMVDLNPPIIDGNGTSPFSRSKYSPRVASVWDARDGRLLLTVTDRDLPRIVSAATWWILSVVGVVWLVAWCRSQWRQSVRPDGQRDYGWLFVCIVAGIAVVNGSVIFLGSESFPFARVETLSIVEWIVFYRLALLPKFLGLTLLVSLVAGFWLKFQRFNFALGLGILVSILVYDLWEIHGWWLLDGQR